MNPSWPAILAAIFSFWMLLDASLKFRNSWEKKILTFTSASLFVLFTTLILLQEPTNRTGDAVAEVLRTRVNELLLDSIKHLQSEPENFELEVEHLSHVLSIELADVMRWKHELPENTKLARLETQIFQLYQNVSSISTREPDQLQRILIDFRRSFLEI